MRRVVLIALVATVTAAIAVPAQTPAPAAASVSVLLRPARVFDAVSQAPHEGWAVLVTGHTIAAAGPAAEIKAPAGATMIDLPGATLMPGLIDAHSHIYLHPYNEATWNDQVMKETLAYRTVAAVIYCKDTLLAGFTSLRDLGTEGAEYADVSVQQAINEGRIPGPRLQVATKAIVASASYGPGPRGFATSFELPRGAEEVSGVDRMLWAVRDQIGHGADWVKLYADYRRGPNGSNVPTLNLAEIQAAVEESTSAGRPVAVHASHPEGMRRAVVAGARTIEHGYGGTDETFALMAEKRVALFPTLAAQEASAIYNQGYKPGVSKPTPSLEQGRRAFQSALTHNVVDRPGKRRRRLRARHQRARTGVDGRVWHDARASAHGRDDRQCEGHGMGRQARRRKGRVSRGPRCGGGRPDARHHGRTQGDVRDEGRGGLPAVGD